MILEEYNQDLQTHHLSEPQRRWGSTWTDEKLDAFEKYVKAYLTILNKYKRQFGWSTIYIDAFAGSGSCGEEDLTGDDGSQSLFDPDVIEDFTVDDSYKGAAERVLGIEGMDPFDYYFFIDKEKDAIEGLEQMLREKNYLSGRNCYFSCTDANDQLRKISESLYRSTNRALALLDPFGMQVEWSTIEALSRTHCDLWILVPSGVIINRLIKRDGTLLYPDKLTKFFGLSEDEICEIFYKKRVRKSLFEEVEDTVKISNATMQIAMVYLTQLKKVFECVIDEPLVLYNSRNVPIFHFVFASHNETAKKIASEIIARKKG